jgi:hypothetical protein
MKKLIVIILGLAFGAVFLYAETVQDLQRIDGETRNRLADIIGSGGGGGGGPTTAAVTNANNTFTSSSINTFNAQTFLTNTTINGYVGINTNINSGVYSMVARPAAGAIALWKIRSSSASDQAALEFDDGSQVSYIGTDGGGVGGNYRIVMSSSGGAIRLIANGIISESITETTYVLGVNSSSAGTLNGSTLTLAHGPAINGGVLTIPIAGGTVSNNTSFVTQNTLGASNVVVKSFDGTTTINSGTNLLTRIISGSSAGILQTEALFTSRTNTLTAATPVVNAIYTNNAIRLNLNVSATFGATSAGYIWVLSGAQTNEFSLKSNNGVGAVTNSMDAWIPPSALYMVSNSLGTITLHPGRWNETRF